jgi:hypothetical protein
MLMANAERDVAMNPYPRRRETGREARGPYEVPELVEVGSAKKRLLGPVSGSYDDCNYVGQTRYPPHC